MSIHHDWLASWQQEVQADYARLHAAAGADIQRAGHGGEATWVRLLNDWLPPQYATGIRKYIVPEDGSRAFETDLVVFNPGYPERLRQREEVLAGGVAAAFSVKLTLDSSGLSDGVKRAAELRRAMKVRHGTPRHEMLGAFPVGILAHSHNWKAPRSNPRENIRDGLWKLDHSIASHPRETLDLLCVADLTTITTIRMPYLHPRAIQQSSDAAPPSEGCATTAMTMLDEDAAPGPVAVLIAALLGRLALSDPSISPFADGLRLTETLGSGSGWQRRFALGDVFGDQVRSALPRRAFSEGDWRTSFY